MIARSFDGKFVIVDEKLLRDIILHMTRLGEFDNVELPVVVTRVAYVHDPREECGVRCDVVGTLECTAVVWRGYFYLRHPEHGTTGDVDATDLWDVALEMLAEAIG